MCTTYCLIIIIIDRAEIVLVDERAELQSDEMICERASERARERERERERERGEKSAHFLPK